MPTMSSQAKAQGFLKDLGIIVNLEKEQSFNYGGVDFEFSVSSYTGAAVLFFAAHEVFDSGYTNTALFDHGAAVKVRDTDGLRSTKKHFAADMKTAIKFAEFK